MKFFNVKHLSIFIVALSSLMSMVTVHAQNTFGIAESYNAFVLHDFYARNSSAGGRVAAGNNVSLASYSVATEVIDADVSLTLIAGGDFKFSNGSLAHGSAIAGGSINGVADAVIQSLREGATIEGDTPSDISFVKEFARLISRSDRLAAVTPTGTVETKWGGVYLTGDCTSPYQIFNVGAEVLSQSTSLNVDCVPHDANLVINVSGENAEMSNIGLHQLATRASMVLFNFHDARSLKLSSVEVHGSVLAPRAAVRADNGRLNGSVFAASWNGSMALVNQPFDSNLAILFLNDNTAPSVHPLVIEYVIAGQPHFGGITAFDREGDPLSYQLVDAPQGMYVDDTGRIFWPGEFTVPGEFDVVWEVTDSYYSVSGTLTFRVLAPNRPPVVEEIKPIVLTTHEAAIVPIRVSDPDGDAVTISINNQPDFIKLDNNFLVIEPDSGDVGEYLFYIGVADANPNQLGFLVLVPVSVTIDQ